MHITVKNTPNPTNDLTHKDRDGGDISQGPERQASPHSIWEHHQNAYDDAAVAPLVTPPLTTVRQQNHEMGARATAMLVGMLNGKRIERQVFLSVDLVVRQSCGANR